MLTECWRHDRPLSRRPGRTRSPDPAVLPRGRSRSPGLPQSPEHYVIYGLEESGPSPPLWWNWTRHRQLDFDVAEIAWSRLRSTTRCSSCKARAV